MSKKSQIIMILIFVLAGFFVFIFSRGVFKAGQVEKNNFILPEEIALAGESIPLLWTDNNDGENLIIKSDRQYYDGRDSSEVYFSITNISDKDQKPDIKFLFDEKEGRGMKEIALLNSQNDVIASGQTNFYKAVIYYPQNSKGEFFIEAKGDNGGYGFLDPYYASGLVGYWSFNGPDIAWQTNTAYDRSGTSPANNGTITNMSTTTSPVAGISGQALSFDGVDDYVTMGSTPQSTMNTTNQTVSFWFKPNVNFTSALGREDFISRTTGGPYALYDYDNGAIGYYYYNSASALGKIIYASNFSAGVWYHFVGVHNASNGSLYINGVGVGTPTNIDMTTPYAGAATMVIGNYFLISNFLNAVVDDFRIYNRALGASEVTDLYRLGAARMKANTPLSGRFKDSSLVGYWSFDGANMGTTSATDLSGNSNTGWLINGPKKTEGINGQALKFDGVDDYVNLGYTLATDGATQASWSFWMKPSALISSATMISKTDGNYSPFSWRIALYGTAGAVVLDFANSNSIVFTTTNPLAVSTWAHVVAVYDGSQSTPTTKVKIYVNGVLQSESSAGTIPTSLGDASTRTLKIGAESYGATARNYFNGLLDDVRIYNRVLTASEIADQYRAGAARLKVNTPETNVLKSGLVGYWSFDGQNTNWTSATAGTTNDLSGSYATGTMTNMSRSASPVPGISGQALSFDGADDYVSLSGPTATNIQTISLWFKVISYPTGWGTLFSQASDLGLFVRSTNKIDFYYSGSHLNNTAFDPSKWHHLAVVNNGGNATFYIDGVADGTCTSAPGIIVTRFCWDGAALDKFNGLIDEVRIYNRALTADEIGQLYRAGAKRVKFKP